MENLMLKIVCLVYKTLHYVANRCSNLQLLSWWNYAQCKPADTYKCRYVVKLLLNCSKLKCNAIKYDTEVTDVRCNFCDNEETLSHILFQCHYNQMCRASYWERVDRQCPQQLKEHLQNISAEDKCSFTITCLCNGYTPKWINMFYAILNFIYYICVKNMLTQ